MKIGLRLLAIACLATPQIAAAQEEGRTLPPPALPDEEPSEPADPEREEPRVLMRITRGQVDDDLAPEEEPEHVERDVARPIPGDLRMSGQTSEVRFAESGGPPATTGDPPEAIVAEATAANPPAPFSVAAGASFARLLAGTRDFLLIEQRFEARLPEFPALRLGVGVNELFELAGNGFAIKGGPRIGLGVHLFDLGELSAEGVVSIQPGVIGSTFGWYFDLHADLDVRFLFFRTVEVAVTGGFSLIGESSILEVGGLIAIPFG